MTAMRKKIRSNKTIYIGIAIAGLLSLLGMALIGGNSPYITRSAPRSARCNTCGSSASAIRISSPRTG